MPLETPLSKSSARAPFVGRGRELAELRAGLREAAAGHGCVFLLSGEPGIGKTRLAEEISDGAAARGFGVAWGRCWQAVGRPAYWPFVQALALALRERRNSTANKIAREVAHLMPGLVATRRARAISPSALNPEQVRHRLFDAVVRMFAALSRRTPLLVVFDDLQDAEHASWLMLRHSARELGAARVMFVAAYRETEVRGDAALDPVIADLLRGARHIGLGGLSRSEVAEIVGHRAGREADGALVARLHSATGGNPFFVTEVASTLAQRGAFDEGRGAGLEIPASVRASIRARVLALGGEPIKVLSAAAALGDLFDLETLQRVAGCELDAVLEVIDAAARAGVVIGAPGGGETWRFAHSLIREALYEDLPAAARMRLHQRCLAVLEDRYRLEPEHHLDQLAHHAVAAAPLGGAKKAIEYASRAGDAAYAAAAFERAAAHYRAGLAMLERDGAEPARVAEMAERLGAALAITEFEHPRGIECLERAAELYEAGKLPVEGARVRARLALLLSRRGPSMDVERAMEEYRRAERVLGAQQDSPSQGWMYCGLSSAAMQAHRISEGLAAGQRAVEIATRLGDARLWMQAEVRCADNLFLAGRFAESIAAADEAWRRADRAGDQEAAFEATWAGGYFYQALWNPREARRWFKRELARPRLAAAPYYRQILTQQVAFSHVMMGDLGRARALLERAPRELTDALALLYEGDWERAEELLDETREAMRAVGSRDLELVHAFFESIVLRTRGRFEREREVVAPAVAMSAESGALLFELHLRVESALMAFSSGRIEEGIEQAERIRARIPEHEDLYGLGGRTTLAAALAAQARGRAAEATYGFAAAMATFRRFGLPWEQAQAHQVRACLLAGRGETTASRRHLEAAAEIYRRHGSGARFTEKIDSEVARIARAAHTGGESASGEANAAANGASDLKWEGSWRAEGEYWTIVGCGAAIRIRDTKGLRYIAALLARPGAALSVLELVRSEVPRAHARNQISRERARLAVTKNIRAAIAKIRAMEPALGRHLATSIRTGYACVYAPGTPARWEVSGPRTVQRRDER